MTDTAKISMTEKLRKGRKPALSSVMLRILTYALPIWLGTADIAHGYVAKCTIAPGSSTSLATLPASLKISADAPINTVLWRQTGIRISASCVKAPGATLQRVQATLYRLANDPQLAANGLALFVTYNGNRGSGSASFPMGTIINSAITATTVSATVDLELVKIAPTPSVPTPLPLLSVPTVLIGGPGSNDASDAARFLTHGWNHISFKPTTCSTTTPSVAVDLGVHNLRNQFGLGSGVGSTSPPQGFAIGLQCDTGVAGKFVVAMMLESNSPIDASSGLLALTSTSTARGVAIQLLKADGNPVPLGTPWNVSDSPSSSATSTVPLLARYYQTDAMVAPGTADGIATFTIVYR